MKLFACPRCRKPIFFENVACNACQAKLLYLPDEAVFGSFESDGTAEGLERVEVALVRSQTRYKLCANYRLHNACNWGTKADESEPFCRACRLNAVIPNLSQPETTFAWKQIEAAKRRLIYTLLALGLPVQSKRERPEGGLAFSFKQDENGGTTKVMTGHDDGHITLNVAEAHAPFREKTRLELGEPYRTLMGHFRHEIGHYYWDLLVRNTSWLSPFRETFGDEREDYDAACRRHYQEGPPADWPSAYVTAYATTHPWEDWAETWAHYLHMVDTLETARAYGLALRPPGAGKKELTMTAQKLDFDDFADLISAWVPLTVAVNSLNRGMGLPDMYPFALPALAIDKLKFVHRVIDSETRGTRAAAQLPVVAFAPA